MIEKGHLPIFIPAERRLDYLETLAAWQLASGPVRAGQSLEGDADRWQSFRSFCESCLSASNALLKEVRALHDARRLG